MSQLRARIQGVLEEAAAIDRAWAEVEAGQPDIGPDDEAWIADDDARLELSYSAVEALRDLVALVDAGEPVDLSKPSASVVSITTSVANRPEGQMITTHTARDQTRQGGA